MSQESVGRDEVSGEQNRLTQDSQGSAHESQQHTSSGSTTRLNTKDRNGDDSSVPPGVKRESVQLSTSSLSRSYPSHSQYGSYNSPPPVSPQADLGRMHTRMHPGPHDLTSSASSGFENESPPSSFGQTTFLMSAGAVLGLTAAAAVRWLNGGDFAIFPDSASSSTGNTSIGLRPKSSPLVSNHHIDPQSAPDIRNRSTGQLSDSHDLSNQDESVSRQLHEDINSLVDALRDQSRQQASLVQQLVRRDGTRYVDQSMDLLRQQQQASGNRLNQESMEVVHGDENGGTGIRTNLNIILDHVTYLQQSLENRDTNGNSLDIESFQMRLSDMKKVLESCIDKSTTATKVSISEKPCNSVVSFGPPSAVGLTPSKLQISANLEEAVVTAMPIEYSGLSSAAGLNALDASLQKLFEQNSHDMLREGTPLLYLYVSNLEKHPLMPRYRKIFTSNESFQTKIQPLVGGIDLLKAVGFTEMESSWQWLPAESKSDAHDHPEHQKQREEEYLEYLREAAKALKTMQQQLPPKESEAAPFPCSPLRVGLESLSRTISSHEKLPSDASSSSVAAPLNDALRAALLCPQTPDPSIKSPPIPKKQIFMNDDVHDEGSGKTLPVAVEQDGSSAGIPCPSFSIRGQNKSTGVIESEEAVELDETTNALWK